RYGRPFFCRLDVPVYRAADIEDKQHFDGVVLLRPNQNAETAVMRGAIIRPVVIKLVRRAGARKWTKAAQRVVTATCSRSRFTSAARDRWWKSSTRRPERSCSIASITVRYSRSVTGRPACFNS